MAFLGRYPRAHLVPVLPWATFRSSLRDFGLARCPRELPIVRPSDRPYGISVGLRLNGYHAKADVVVTPLRFEAQATGGPARPAVVGPAPAPAHPRHIARP